MARRLVLVPGVGLVSYNSDAPVANQISISGDSTSLNIDTQIESISPVYVENGKSYVDIRDERSGEWVKLELSEAQVAAFVANKTSNTISATTLGPILLSDFTANTAKGLASGKPQFTLPYNNFTIYGPYADGGHAYLAVWVGSEWKYIDLDQQSNQVVASATIDYWKPDTDYTNQVVIQANTLWKCKVQHTSSSAFDTVYWQVLSTAGSVSHDSLTGINNDPLFLHVTQSDIDLWNSYQSQIDKLSTGTNISTSISIQNDPALDSLSNLDPHTITEAKFLIKGASPTDSVTLNDASKVTSVPASLIGQPSVQQISGAWYLTVPLTSVAYGTTYTINISNSCVIMNQSMINVNTIKCIFKTSAAPSQPVIGPSTTDGKFGLDPASITSVSFPVTCASGTLDLRLQDALAYSCTPQNIISGAPQVDAGGKILSFSLQLAQIDTEYTITAKSGIVSNAGYATNATPQSVKFGTTLSIPTVGASPDTGNTSVDVTSSNKSVRFPLSTPSTRGQFDVADASKITVSGTASITGSAIISNVLYVYYTGGIDGDVQTFTVNPGAIKNYNSLGDLKLNTNTATCSIQYSVRAPVVSQPAINGNQDVDPTLTTIDVPYSSTAVCTLDPSKISSTPASKVTASTLAVASSQKVIRLTLAPMTNDESVLINLSAGIILNAGVTPSNAVAFSFKCTAVAPVVSEPSINGTSVNAASVTQINFPVTGTSLAVANSSLITMTPSAISGTPTIANNILTVPVSLSPNVSYSVTVNPGAVKNRNTTNTQAVTCSFATATTLTVNQSPTSGTRVPTTTSTVTFPITNINGTVSLADATKITASGCAIQSCYVSASTLTVTISGLQYSSSASITVAAGAVKDSIMTTTSSITATFTTTGDVPVVNQSPSNTLTKVSVSVGYIEFPVTASGTVAISDASKVTSSQPSTIASCTITGSQGAYKLRVNLNILSAGTSYTITVNPGSVSNDTTLSTNTVQATFKTTDAVPTVSQSSINGTTVDSSTLSSISFPITSQSPCSVASLSLITVANGPSLQSATVSGTNLVIVLANLTVNQSPTITIKPGAIQNADSVANTSTTTCTFSTKGDVPVITQSPADQQSTLALSPSYIEYAITCSGTPAIANANLITVSPNHFQSASIVSNKLRITINMINDTQYTVTLNPGLLVNQQTLSTQTIQTTFKTIKSSPVISQSSLNGTTQPVGSTTLSFPITTTGTPSITNQSLIAATNASVSSASISGSNLLVSVTTTQNSKQVTISLPAGLITNGETSNLTGITCSFTTAGSVPVVNLPSVSGTTIPKTTASISFPITGISGTLSLASASAVVVPSGYDSIISSVSVSGSNLVVALNTSAMVYNKAYAIQVGAGAVSNDEVTNAGSVTCTFTTQAGAVVVAQSAAHGVTQALSLSSISFGLSAPSIAGTYSVSDSSKVSIVGATISNVAISGSNLVVSLSNLQNSQQVSVTIAAGAVSNNGVVNVNSVTCTFLVCGAVLTIGQSSVNGTEVTAGSMNVDFPLTGTSFGGLSVVSAKVGSTPAAISATASVVTVGGLKYLRVPMTVASGGSYTVNIGAGAVVNDTTASVGVVACSFTVAAGGTSRVVLWSESFNLANAAFTLGLYGLSDWGSKTLTLEDIYGPAYDGTGALAELRWYGYVGNILYPNGLVVPRSGIDSLVGNKSPDGGYSYDDATGILTFDNGSPSPKVYKLIKYVA